MKKRRVILFFDSKNSKDSKQRTSKHPAPSATPGATPSAAPKPACAKKAPARLAFRARRWACLALAALLALGLCGCGEEEGVFVGRIAEVPATLDPQLAATDGERIAAVNLFEGLFRLGADGQPQPAACQSYTVSEDGLTWTFTLREGLFYNDGDDKTPATPVTAQDFVFALRRVLAPDSGSPYAGVFSGLAGAEALQNGNTQALGAYAVRSDTLVLCLSAPDDQLPRKLCCPGAMPCNRAFFEAAEGTYGLNKSTLLANGAFRLTLWSDDNGLTLRRVQPQEGLVNKVRLLPLDPTEDTAAALADGTLSGAFLTGMPPTDATETFCVQTRLLLFNCADPALAQPQVRGALAAVLYRALSDSDQEGVATGEGLVPDSITLGGRSWRAWAGDVRRDALPADPVASYREGLAAAGDSKLKNITVLLPDTAEWQALYQDISLAWQQQLSAFFSVQLLPEEEIAAAVADGDYQLAFVTHRAAEDDVAAELAYFGGPDSPTGLDDPEVAALLADAVGAEAADRLRAAETRLLALWPAVPMQTLQEYYALAPGYGHVAATPLGPLLDFAAATAPAA